MEIINLLNGKEFCPSLSIIERLLEGMKTQTLVYTQNFRGIGKTRNLIEFARKYKFWVVVRAKGNAESLRVQYDYPDIYGQDDIRLRKMQIVVVDECVDMDKLLREQDCKIITGFTNIKPTEKIKELSFTDKILKDLKVDAINLSSRLEKDDNNANYKMLITNLRLTMDLIQELEIEPKKETLVYNTNNITFPNVLNVDQVMKEMESLSKNCKGI